MKLGYLISALVISVVLLIIAFQNISTSSSFWMFLESKNMPMTFPVLVLSALGMVAGSLYTLAIQSALHKKEEERHEEETSEF